MGSFPGLRNETSGISDNDHRLVAHIRPVGESRLQALPENEAEESNVKFLNAALRKDKALTFLIESRVWGGCKLPNFIPLVR